MFTVLVYGLFCVAAGGDGHSHFQVFYRFINRFGSHNQADNDGLFFVSRSAVQNDEVERSSTGTFLAMWRCVTKQIFCVAAH